ncbi:hypothetical protein BDC45DRAFT_591522 [Circinella umbellata]|nr:hypothetical protein BDC45DRAFT_591522 [Circinella umbellata]
MEEQLWELVLNELRNVIRFQKGILFIQNCVFRDEVGFDINMHHTRAWSRHGAQAITASISVRIASHTLIGVVSSFGVVNASIRETDNVKKRRVVGATKQEAAGDAIADIRNGATADHYLYSSLVINYIYCGCIFQHEGLPYRHGPYSNSFSW